MDIVKAEILWTRLCNLNCGYCAMKKPKEQGGFIKKDITLWKQGFNRLKDLGCSFTAFYGAEPLIEFEGLPEVIKHTTDIGLFHTLITSCVVNNLEEKLTILNKNGLQSITVSFDGHIESLTDTSSKAKTVRGIETLRWYKKTFPNSYRDLAIVFTAHKQNLLQIPEYIKALQNEGIWVFFDFIHPALGRPGSKTKNSGDISNLTFNSNDRNIIIEFANKMLELKKSNRYNIHSSELFLNYIKDNPEVIINYTWNCTNDNSFPSWVTINNDGQVYPCDDLQPTVDNKIYFWDLNKQKYDEFGEYWKPIVKSCCGGEKGTKGCFWNTHFDANAIKLGLISVEGYVHTEGRSN